MDEESSVGCIDGERNPISIFKEIDQRTKRHKTLTAQDRISALPDLILLDILSSLPTKDAIKTVVLSKRWTSLWSFVPSLSFNDNSFANYDIITTAVDATLAQHTAPKLTKFFVKSKYHSQLKPCLDAWVHFATTTKVDQLNIKCFRDLKKF